MEFVLLTDELCCCIHLLIAHRMVTFNSVCEGSSDGKSVWMEEGSTGVVNLQEMLSVLVDILDIFF